MKHFQYKHTPPDLLDKAQWIYDIQYRDNPVYRAFVDAMGMQHRSFRKISEMPFLPISAWKHHAVKTGEWESDVIYTSSGTGGSHSRHYVRDNQSYLDNCVAGWEQFYGPIEDYAFLALLPSYLDREGSSLITMMQHFIKLSASDESAFYLRNHDDLLAALRRCREQGIPTVLWGVTYALLDLGEIYNVSDWPNLIIVETGGMKGTRPEMIKPELHKMLSGMYNVEHIHSEYGMTELLSQAYSQGEGVFYPADTMHVHCRDLTDPLGSSPIGKTGIIHVFDTKNINTCAFVATNDLGRMRPDGGFEILGRVDYSEARGCNLLLEEVA